MEPLAVDVKEAGRLLGISQYTVRHYIRQGKINPVRFGTRITVPMTEIERLSCAGIPALPKTPSKEENQ